MFPRVFDDRISCPKRHHDSLRREFSTSHPKRRLEETVDAATVARCKRLALEPALYSAIPALDRKASAVERESVTPHAVSDSASPRSPLPPSAARDERPGELNAQLAVLETRVRALESQPLESFAEDRRAPINSIDSVESDTFVPS